MCCALAVALVHTFALLLVVQCHSLLVTNISVYVTMWGYSGDHDELVPPFHMKKLYDLATSSDQREFFNVPGGTHNDTWNRAGADYYRVSYMFYST